MPVLRRSVEPARHFRHRPEFGECPLSANSDLLQPPINGASWCGERQLFPFPDIGGEEEGGAGTSTPEYMVRGIASGDARYFPLQAPVSLIALTQYGPL